MPGNYRMQALPNLNSLALAASGLKRQDYDLIVVERAAEGVTFEHAFEAPAQRRNFDQAR